MNNLNFCSRCGNPTKITKSWIEIIETRSGKSKLTHTQLACTDEKCEKEFIEKSAEEVKKREAMRMRNEVYASKKISEKKSLGTIASEKKIIIR